MDSLSIPGLFNQIGAVSAELVDAVTTFLSGSDLQWSSVSSNKSGRAVLHYGFYYSYRGRRGTRVEAPPLPTELAPLLAIIRQAIDSTGRIVVPSDMPLDQCIVNRYMPGQGIGKHTDAREFDDFICCFTFGHGAEMEFTRQGHDSVRVYTQPASLYIMSGEARHTWQHQMRGRRSDPSPAGTGRISRQGPRYSVTFRSLRST